MEEQQNDDQSYAFHRRYWRRNNTKEIPFDILIPRLFTILSWLYIILIESLVYSNGINSSNVILNFLFGFSYSLKNINAIAYAAGAAAYGASMEIYLLIPWMIINSIVAINNCGINHSEVKGSVLFMITTMALLFGTELAHQNFKRFIYRQSYQMHYQTATRAILRPSIYLCVTVLFLISPGLRAIYNAARLRCPYTSETLNRSTCLLIDMNRPAFTDHDPCMPDFASMVTSFEQLRLLRDIALCSIAFYSMYNKAFLDITGIVSITHKLVLFLFLTLSWSVIAASIDPFQFKEWKIYFDLIELMMFIMIMILLMFNLRRKSSHRHQVMMEVNPTIFG